MQPNNVLKIMLADDDEDDRDLFMEAVESPETSVSIVPNGRHLMQALNATGELPHCIFLDLNMPEKGGKECLREIRNNERLKDLPIIIYSTSSNRKDIDDTFEMGANLYVCKPNSFADLTKTLKSILKINWSNCPTFDRGSFVFSIP